MTALRGLDRRAGGARDIRSPLLIVAGAVIALLAGVAAPRYGQVCLAACGAAVLLASVAWAVRKWGPGIAVGLLLLGAVDALPGPDTETYNVFRTIKLADVVTIILALVLACIAYAHRDARGPSHHERLLRIWSVILLAFWLVGGGRAWVFDSVPLFNGLFWARQFLYLAVLAPLFARVLSIRSVRDTTLVVCAIGLCVAAAAQIVTVVGGHTVGLLVHLTRTADTAGLIRLYSGSDWLIPAGIPFGLGLLLFGGTRRQRIVGATLLVFSFAAVAVELTRALYIGLVVGMTVTTVLWLMVGDTAGRLGRRRGLQVVVIVGAMCAALILFRPPVVSGSVVNGVVVRATSVFADISGPGSQDPDLAYRNLEASTLREYLGGSWLFGKGFQDPSYYNVPQVLGGSIQLSDVGYLSSVMTIGVAGTLVLYSAFFYLALVLAYQRIRRRGPARSWMAYGCLAWLLIEVISSVTLAIMLSVVGAVPSAAILGLACVCAVQASGAVRSSVQARSIPSSTV